MGLSVLLAIVVVVVAAPRRWAVIGVAAGVLYLTQGLFVTVSGLTIYAARFVEVAAFVRVVARREVSLDRLSGLDWLLLGFHIYTVLVFVVRSNEDRAYQIGSAMDALLIYVAIRGLIISVDELATFLRLFVLLLAPFALLVTIETITSENPFARIGGVELIRAGDRWMREGRLRATGSFGHPSLMGTLGGSFFPLYVGLVFHEGRHRGLAILGSVLCLVTVWASNSGGPMTCVVSAALGWALWPVRRSMHWVRRGGFALLALLAMVMKAPIWYLLARISAITGGDGYHRSVLMDVAFQNISRWWLAGMRTLETSNWLPYTNTTTGAVDVTNHFLVYGITAGLGSVLLLIALVVGTFRGMGRSIRVVRERVGAGAERLLWGLGVAIGVHVFNWFGISYWDQSAMLWNIHLAVASTLSRELSFVTWQAVAQRQRSTAPVVVQRRAACVGSGRC